MFRWMWSDWNSFLRNYLEQNNLWKGLIRALFLNWVVQSRQTGDIWRVRLDQMTVWICLLCFCSKCRREPRNPPCHSLNRQVSTDIILIDLGAHGRAHCWAPRASERPHPRCFRTSCLRGRSLQGSTGRSGDRLRDLWQQPVQAHQGSVGQSGNHTQV